MSSVDDRIVNMEFNNKQFTQGVDKTQRDLTGLEKTLAKTGKSKGLENLAASATTATGKFSAMRVAGVAAVATIASKATLMGLNLAKSLTVAPLLDGFREYQTNLTSIQTVMANTGAGVNEVNGYMQKLNQYSDKTIYNFSEMARNIGTFTAAGVGLKDATSAIQGISNIAALSGSTSQQASTAMYQLSQAIAAGRVGLQDWNSVVNAGMGGKNLQKALIQTGQAMGTVTDKVDLAGKTIKIAGSSFRESISTVGGKKSWLTSDVLVKTLSLMDGRLSKASIQADHLGWSNERVTKTLEKQQNALKKQGFSNEQIASLTKMANAAYNSATVVKTLPQLMDVTKEAIGSVWAQAFQSVMGNFNSSKRLWTKASVSITAGINMFGHALIGTLEAWRKAGGRQDLIRGFKAMFGSLIDILGTVKSAFHDVFPSKGAGQGLAEMTHTFATFMQAIRPSTATLESLRSIFGGIFAVFHIGFTIVSALGAAFSAFFGQIFKNTGKGTGGILAFAASLGEFLMHIDKVLTSGGEMVDMFRNVGKAAGGMAAQGIDIASGIIGGIVEGMSGAAGQIQAAVVDVANGIVEWFKSELGIHSPATALIPVGTNIIFGIMEGIAQTAGEIGRAIGELVGHLISNLLDSLQGLDPIEIASILNAIFTGALILSMKKITDDMGSFMQIGNSITGAFRELTGTLKTMQTTLKAQALMAIAIAVGVLVASLVAMSFLDPKEIAIGIGAISAMMGVLVGAILALSKVQRGEEGFNLIAMATALVGVATAILILSAAVAVLGSMDMMTLAKGLGAIAIAMGIMLGAFVAMAAIRGSIEGMAASILIIAIAMNALAMAVLALGSMDMKTLEKGLGAIAIGLGLMVAAMLAMDFIQGSVEGLAASILVMSLAMVVLAGAVGTLGSMDIPTLAKGLGAIAIGLGLFIAAFALMTPMAPAIAVLAPAIMLMSLAMVALATAVAILGNMSLESLGKGLAAIAVGFAILLLAAAGAIAVAPGLIVLSVVMVSLGQGLALAGLGMLAFATGFAIFAAAGVAGVAVLGAAFELFIAFLPTLAVQMAAALVGFLQAIAAASPKIRKAMSTIIKNMLGTVKDAIPEIGKLFSKLLETGLKVIGNFISDYVEMGFKIIDEFLKSANKHIPDIVDSVTKLATTFIHEMGKKAVDLANAGADMLVDVLNGLADAVDSHGAEIRTAAGNLASAFAEQLRLALASLIPNIPIPDIPVPKVLGKIINKVAGNGRFAADSGAGRRAAGKGSVKRAPRLTPEQKYVKGLMSFASAFSTQMKNVATVMTSASQLLVGASSGPAYSYATGAASYQKSADYYKEVANQRETSSANAQAAADKRVEDAQKRMDKAKDMKKKTAAQKAKRAAAIKAATAAKTAAAAEKRRANAQSADADAQAKKAEQQQALADERQQQARDELSYQTADTRGKGDIRSQQGQDLAARAQAKMASAQAKADEARRLSMKGHSAKDLAQARALRSQAAAEAKAANDLAIRARTAEGQAIDLYAAARREAAAEVVTRMDNIQKQLDLEDAARAWQNKYDATTTDAEKIQMLNDRAAASEAAELAARNEMKAQLAIAAAMKDTDSAAAQLALDKAEAQAQLASQYADKADQDRDQVTQMLKQAEDAAKETPGDTTAPSTITPSRTALEDAALAVDRYTASVGQAEEMAMAGGGTVQYVQNNYSPEALSASTIYRQTKNLTAGAYIKMGGIPE